MNVAARCAFEKMRFELLPNGESTVRVRHLVVEVDCWLGLEEAVRPIAASRFIRKLCTLRCRVHKLHHVFKYVVHGLDNAPLRSIILS